jgi:acetyl-CoA acyltransferase
MRQAVIIDAVRTPVGRAHPEKGMYRDVRADDLSADIMKALLEKARVPPALIEDIHWGCVKQEKEQGYDVARMAALIAAKRSSRRSGGATRSWWKPPDSTTNHGSMAWACHTPKKCA